MLFRPLAALISGVLFTQVVLAALSPDQVVTNIKLITTVSGNLNNIVGGLTTTLSFSDIKTIAQLTTTNFQTIITSLAGDVTAMQATPPFADGVTQPIVNALSDFVRIHQALLSTVIGKRGILAQFGLTAPIAVVLSSLEAGIDSFAFAMINLIPTRKGDVTNDKNNLDGSVQTTISSYQKICLPNILYPKYMPICI